MDPAVHARRPSHAECCLRIGVLQRALHHPATALLWGCTAPQRAKASAHPSLHQLQRQGVRSIESRGGRAPRPELSSPPLSGSPALRKELPPRPQQTCGARPASDPTRQEEGRQGGSQTRPLALKLIFSHYSTLKTREKRPRQRHRWRGHFLISLVSPIFFSHATWLTGS